jgi:hypothetical protein
LSDTDEVFGCELARLEHVCGMTGNLHRHRERAPRTRAGAASARIRAQIVSDTASAEMILPPVALPNAKRRRQRRAVLAAPGRLT